MFVTVNVPAVLKQCVALKQEVVSDPSPKFQVALKQVVNDVSVNETHNGAQPDKIFAEISGTGCGSTETVTTEFVDGVPQLSVTVTVYEVVDAGDATGLEIDELLSPVTGDHEYVKFPLPPLAVDESGADDDSQIAVAFVVTTDNGGLTSIVTVLGVELHPVASVAITE